MSLCSAYIAEILNLSHKFSSTQDSLILEAFVLPSLHQGGSVHLKKSNFTVRSLKATPDLTCWVKRASVKTDRRSTMWILIFGLFPSGSCNQMTENWLVRNYFIGFQWIFLEELIGFMRLLFINIFSFLWIFSWGQDNFYWKRPICCC